MISMLDFYFEPNDCTTMRFSLQFTLSLACPEPAEGSKGSVPRSVQHWAIASSRIFGKLGEGLHADVVNFVSCP